MFAKAITSIQFGPHVSKDNRHSGIFLAQAHKDFYTIRCDRVESMYPNRETVIIGQGLEHRSLVGNQLIHRDTHLAVPLRVRIVFSGVTNHQDVGRLQITMAMPVYYRIFRCLSI